MKKHMYIYAQGVLLAIVGVLTCGMVARLARSRSRPLSGRRVPLSVEYGCAPEGGVPQPWGRAA